MVVGFKLPVQSVPIITKVVISNPTYEKMYSIKHNMISLSVTKDRSMVFSGFLLQ